MSWIRDIITNLSRSIPSSWVILGQSVNARSSAYEPVEWWDRWERVETCVLSPTATTEVPHGHSSLAWHTWLVQRSAERLEDSLRPWWDCYPSRSGVDVTVQFTSTLELLGCLEQPFRMWTSLMHDGSFRNRSRLKIFIARKCCVALFRSRPY